MIIIDKQSKLQYVAPLVEVDEYIVEKGFATSWVYDREEVSHNQDEEGDYEMGGYFNINV